MPFTYHSVPQADFKDGVSYPVRIAKAGFVISKTSGKEMIKLTVVPLDKALSTVSLFYYIVDDEYAQRKLYFLFQSCHKSIADGEEITPQTFAGLTGTVVVKLESYQGEMRPTIDRWIVDDTMAPLPPVPEEVEEGMPF